MQLDRIKSNLIASIKSYHPFRKLIEMANNTPVKLRMYVPLWEAIKKHKTVTIAAPAKKHRLIVRMVSKEKWLDQAYKDKLGWRMEWLSYTVNAEKTEITFRLNFRLNELLPGEF